MNKARPAVKAMKAIKVILCTLAALALVAACLPAGRVFAGTLSVRIEQPKTPTNQTGLNINFVILDQGGTTPITAKCYFSKGGDAPSQFGSDIAISAGGNTANCVTNDSIIHDQATYHFYVTADNGSGPVSSATVDVSYDTSGPDTPTSYSKEDFESCKYKIKFHTADDGLTSKVELYRSPNTTFDVNSGSLVATQTIGPNTDGEFINDKPDCGKTYYYAIRAFDSIGNGSGIRGDSETHTVTTTILPTTTTGGGGAIPSGTGGNILGAEASEGATGPTGVSALAGTVLGEEASPSATPTSSPTPTPKPTLFTGKNISIGGGILVILIILFFLFK